MTYSCKYRNNPTFPYSKRTVSRKYSSNTYNPSCNNQKTPSSQYKKQAQCHENYEEKKEPFAFFDSPFIRSFLDPVEKLIGRKISFDDILLLVLIYILFTEKDCENDNKTLILCLLFTLFGS